MEQSTVDICTVCVYKSVLHLHYKLNLVWALNHEKNDTQTDEKRWCDEMKVDKQCVYLTFTGNNKSLALNIQPTEVSCLSRWDVSRWLFYLRLFRVGAVLHQNCQKRVGLGRRGGVVISTKEINEDWGLHQMINEHTNHRGNGKQDSMRYNVVFNTATRSLPENMLILYCSLGDIHTFTCI